MVCSYFLRYYCKISLYNSKKTMKTKNIVFRMKFYAFLFKKHTQKYVLLSFFVLSQKMFSVWLCLFIPTLLFAGSNENLSNISPEKSSIQFRVNVLDSLKKTPLQMSRVWIRKNNTTITSKATNTAGLAVFTDVSFGKYEISVRCFGYINSTKIIVIDSANYNLTFLMNGVDSKVYELEGVEVTSSGEQNVASVDMRSGNQIFESETYHASPTSQVRDLIQRNVMGVAKAPTGEVHIRGQHGEFTYYVDGIPIPLGVFGGLNEVVDAKVIDRATFVTGGFPAEYGGQSAAIIDIESRVPSGQFHANFSTYTGSYFVFNGLSGDIFGERVGAFRAINSNGQSLSLSNHVGNFGYFVSGSRQENDRRIDTPVPNLYHDRGSDYFLYGKFDYLLSDVDYLTMNLNYGLTNTQIPFDSNSISDDTQKTTNSFQTLSYFHTISSEKEHESNLFLGGYAREGRLIFTPGSIDVAEFKFATDSSKKYVLAEDRSFLTLGIRGKYDIVFSHEFSISIGMNASLTNGKENFTSRDSLKNSGPSVKTNFTGSDFGVFAESQWHPFEWARFDIGLRYDQHIAPDAHLQNQVSPRLRWNIFIDEMNILYLYYGKLFMPNNIEGIRTIASNVSQTSLATLPEKDDFYEISYVHNFPFGLRNKTAMFYKHTSPGVDDQTIGSSSIKTPVNIENIRTTGIETGFFYSNHETPLSGYFTASIIHAYGSGLITGGFLDFATAGAATDLDHDQRLSMVFSLNYQKTNWFAQAMAIYSSGLTNGNLNNEPYKTGLFDFNTGAHTTPGWVINVSAGYTFHSCGMEIEPSIFVNNLIDHERLIKGSFFSAASFEERRNVVLKLGIHL